MATLTIHPHFIFIALVDSGHAHLLANALRKARIASSLLRSTALYAYSTDLSQVRRIVNQVLCGSSVPHPFEWPSVEPIDWIAFFTPVAEPWSFRFKGGVFEAWDGKQWRIYDLETAADRDGYSIDLSQLALALSDEKYHPRRLWCCWGCRRRGGVI